MVSDVLASMNHIKLSRLHAGLAIAYGILLGGLLAFGLGGLNEQGNLAVSVLSVLLPGLHIGLAWGCKRQSEIARVISLVVGFVMLLWLPIGTLIGYFIIRLADWKSCVGQKTYAAQANGIAASLGRAGISHGAIRKAGLILALIPPIALAVMLAGLLPSRVVFAGHWFAAAALLTITPFGLILYFIGRWLRPQ